MIHALKTHYDKVLVGLALLALCASMEWVRWQHPGLGRVRREAVKITLRGTRYEAASGKTSVTDRPVWDEPVGQSSGPAWRYEVFNPPAISYDANRRCLVCGPLDQRSGEAEAGSSALELLEVKREPYRLQLAGYFGEEGPDCLVALARPASPETLLARPGQHFADLGLTLQSLTVEKELIRKDESGPVYEAVAKAVLYDHRAGQEVVLDSRWPRYTEYRVAVIQHSGGQSPLELREGETFTVADSAYAVVSIQLDPAEVVVSRALPELPAPERQRLRPLSRPLPEVGTTSTEPDPADRRFVANGQ